MRTKCNDGNDNKSENINDSDTDDGGIALLFGNGNDDDTGFDDQVGNNNSKTMKIGIRIT